MLGAYRKLGSRSGRALWLVRGKATLVGEAQCFPAPSAPGGVKGFIFGHLGAMDLKGDLGLEMIDQAKRWYRDTGSHTCQVELGPSRQKQIVTRDLNVIREILGPASGSFTNGNAFRLTFGALFPTSVIVVEGAQWKRIRGVIQRAINRLDLGGLPQATLNTCEKAVESWTESSKVVPVVPHFARVSFDAFHKASYQIDFNMVQGENQEILENCIVISRAIGSRAMLPMPFLWSLPTHENREIARALSELRTFTSRFIQQQQAEWRAKHGDAESKKRKPKSLLDAMVRASVDENQKLTLTTDELIDQVLTINFGAFDTTSNTMALLLLNLAKNPHVQEKLFHAVKDIDLKKVTVEELQDNAYLMNTLHENNRVDGIATFVPRDAVEDVVIAGHLIKKGTAVIMDAHSLGHDPEMWAGSDNLDEFRPERWEGGFRPPVGAFLPFGHGGRICPGRKIALANLAAVTAFYLQKFTIQETSQPCEKRSGVGKTLTDESTLLFTKR